MWCSMSRAVLGLCSVQETQKVCRGDQVYDTQSVANTPFHSRGVNGLLNMLKVHGL